MADIGARAAGAGPAGAGAGAGAAVNPLFKNAKKDDLSNIFIDIMYHPRNDIDEEGRTPLHYARSVEVADTLLNPIIKVKEPIDINARDYDGYTPLMRAIQHGQTDTANFLMDKGANIHVFGFDGKTARTLNLSGEIRERLDRMGGALGVEDKDWMQFLDLEPEPEAEPEHENNTGMSKVKTTLFSEGGRRKRKSTRKSKSKKTRKNKSKTKRC